MARPLETAGRMEAEKVVVRFLDGRVLKGYNTRFDVNRPSVALLPEPDVSTASVSVLLTALKAVFFVREFDGNAAYNERKSFVGQAEGRRIQVTFMDGELMIGTTQGYRAGGAGFFITPADPDANNVRSFLVASAVRQLRFP